MTPVMEATEACRPLRADAARNRQLILDTAAEVFAEQGLDAGYDEIARRAGIGVGTVYRRFPERAELVTALFESRIAEIVVLAERSAAMEDPFEALAWFLERVTERQVADRGLKEAMARSVSKDQREGLGGRRLRAALSGLVERAQDAGTLRADVAVSDLALQVMVIGAMTTAAQPELWRRYLALLLDGLRARPGLHPLPLEAPPDGAMYDTMCNMQGRPA